MQSGVYFLCMFHLSFCRVRLSLFDYYKRDSFSTFYIFRTYSAFSKGVPMRERRRKKLLNTAIWLTVVLTTVLLLLTGGVLAMRLGNYIPKDADVIFLTPRKPSMSVEDNIGNWEDVGSVEIFQTQQKNAAGDVVVHSSKNDDVIAPGSFGSYSFYLRNEGNVALDYNISFTAKLIAKNIRLPAENFPFLFRMYDQNGDYTVGGKDSWVTVDEINEVLDKGIVGKNAYYHYTLEWHWPFENGDDGMDTYFGNLSSDRDLVLSLEIASYAQESINPEATGGLKDNGKHTPDIGEVNPWAFGILLALTVGAIVLLIYLLYLRFTKKKRAIPYGALIASSAGVGSALSVMFYKMFRTPRSKKKK